MPKQPLSCVSRPLVTGRLGTSLDGGSSMSSSFHMRGDRKAGEKFSGALRSVRCPRPAIAADMRALRGDMRPDMSSPRLLTTARAGSCSPRVGMREELALAHGAGSCGTRVSTSPLPSSSSPPLSAPAVAGSSTLQLLGFSSSMLDPLVSSGVLSQRSVPPLPSPAIRRCDGLPGRTYKKKKELLKWAVQTDFHFSQSLFNLFIRSLQKKPENL